MADGDVSRSRMVGEWDFYSDSSAIAEYVAHRDRGASRNSLVEEPEFLPLLGEVRGLRCLDLGCGYGHYAEALACAGATVVGVDRSEMMIGTARVRYPESTVNYHTADIQTIDFPAASYDVVVSNLAFHYLADISPVFHRIARWLDDGGRFLFSVEHPILTATRDERLWCEENGSRHWITSDYFDECDRWGFFGRKYHHTFSTWLNTAMDAGFTIARVAEPQPSPSVVEVHSDLAEDLQRPLFLVVSCVKKRESSE